MALAASALALAVVFQLARGDMGVVPAWRSTPGGVTYGDGFIPLCWLLSALATLAWPRVATLGLMSAVGVVDFWWRLPQVPPSVYFHGLVSAQVLLAVLYVRLTSRASEPSEERFLRLLRSAFLAMLLGLFLSAAFHKLNTSSPAAANYFFSLLRHYYMPLLPTGGAMVKVWGLVTAGGELGMVVLLAFRRTRWLALPYCVAFSCLIGSMVYGFGAIVLATALPLLSPDVISAPLARLRNALGLRAVPTAWLRLGFVAAVAGLFFADHFKGFTLADRPYLFAAEEVPGTLDVLTLMQLLWFALSTGVLAATAVATLRLRSGVVVNVTWPRSWVGLLVPVFLVASEAGRYVGVKDSPSLAMFSSVRIKSCEPNHLIAPHGAYASTFHRDLAFARTPAGDTIAMPTLSLQVLLERSRRQSEPVDVVETYRESEIWRVRNAQREAFDFEALEAAQPSSWLEIVLPRRLLFLAPAREEDLRCVMPDVLPPAESPD